MPLKKTLGDLAAEARASVPEVDVDQLAEDFADAIVIDVREFEERARGCIPNSLHVPRGVLERDIERTAFGGAVTDQDLDRPIVCYCGGGSRSLLAAKSLRELGFKNVASLAGGFSAWRKAGRPVEGD
jgi:rhodanese-related sulfurtransferase